MLWEKTKTWITPEQSKSGASKNKDPGDGVTPELLQ